VRPRWSQGFRIHPARHIKRRESARGPVVGRRQWVPRPDRRSSSYSLIQAQKARKAAASASSAGQNLSHRLQTNPKFAAKAANYLQTQKQHQNQNVKSSAQRKPGPSAGTPQQQQKQQPPKSQPKPKEKTQQELDDELKRIARAKKFGAGAESMDTS